MNPYIKLQLHLERHMYKRGQYKGQAPADQTRRDANYFRVYKGNDNTMRVRMHGTDLLTVYEDNRVVINTNGWYDSSTTKLRMNEALRWFIGWGYLTSAHIMSMSQTIFGVGDKKYRYYDGMEFTHDGTLLSTPKPFEMRRIDREASKEFMGEVKSSGFKAMWPVLFATAQLPERDEAIKLGWTLRNVDEIIIDPDRADQWPMLIALYKYPNALSYYRREFDVESKTAWASLMAKCKKGMYVNKTSDVSVL